MKRKGVFDFVSVDFVVCDIYECVDCELLMSFICASVINHDITKVMGH
jgi:hypothetical protein